MKITLGRTILLVSDYDAALKFYQTNLDCRVLFDQTAPSGQRFLHIAFGRTDTHGIWFLKAETEEQLAKVGQQTGHQPMMVLYTDSLKELHERFVRNQVTIVREPVYSPAVSYLHFIDLYGNEIVLVELGKTEAGQ